MTKIKISLSLKILSLLIALLVLSNLFIGVNAVKLSMKDLKTLSNKTLLQAGELVGDQISDFTETQFTLLEALANIAGIKDENVSLKEKCGQIRSIVSIDTNKYENIAFYDENGNTYKADGSTMSLAASPYFKASIKGNKYVSAPALNPHTGTVLMFFSVPVISDNGKIIGVMVSVLKGNPIEEIVRRVDIGDGMHPVVIDLKTHNYVADINPAGEYKEEAEKTIDQESEMWKIFTDLYEGKTETAVFYNSYIKTKLVCSYRPVAPDDPFGCETPWTVFCTAPYQTYFSQLKKLRVSIFGTLAVFLVLGLILGVLFIRVLTKPIHIVKDTINGIASGNADLTQRITVSSNDEIGDVVSSFNMFTEKLQLIMKQIKFSKDNLISAGSELDSGSQDTINSIDQIISGLTDMISKIQSQNNSVTETAGAVNEIASNIESLDRMIENQSRGIMDASSAVEQMVGNINTVTSSVDKMAESFNELSRKATQGEEVQRNATKQIENIKQQSNSLQEANVAITSIASQTNLLAMNAAIEAAHAGEAGKGFAVVADEIRKLSETSAVQSKKIGEELKAIVGYIEAMVQTSIESSQAFNAVNTKITETDELVRQIKGAMEEQTQGSIQISQALKNMNDSSSEVRTASQEMAEGNKSILFEIQALQNTTTEIKDSVDIMTTDARHISETGNALGEIVGKINDSINDIGDQVDLFQV